MFHLKFFRHITRVVFLLGLGVVPLPAQTNDRYLPAEKPDRVAILAPPPVPGSPEQAADLGEVVAIYHACSSNDLATAYSERKFSVFIFTPVVGEFFNQTICPRLPLFLNGCKNRPRG